MKSLSRVPLLATPWTTAYQAPPSMGFSGQEYWSGVPLPSPSHILHPANHTIQLLTIVLLLLLSRFSRVQLCATPQTAAHQAPLSLGFSRQECWSGLPFPPPNYSSAPPQLPQTLCFQVLSPAALDFVSMPLGIFILVLTVDLDKQETQLNCCFLIADDPGIGETLGGPYLSNPSY